jgi:hypothetical protein
MRHEQESERFEGRVPSKIIAVVVISITLAKFMQLIWQTHPHIGFAVGLWGGVLLGECFSPRLKPFRLFLVLAIAALIAAL